MNFYKLQIIFYKNRISICFISIISLITAVVLLELMNNVFLVKLISTLLLVLTSWGLIALATAIKPKDYKFYISGAKPIEGTVGFNYPKIGKALILFEKCYKYILFITSPIIIIYFVFFS